MLVPGALIDGKYRIVKLLGEGGMGSVYEGINIRIERRVAIKVMHPTIARDRVLVGRFEREAQAAAKIGSVHIADVLDLGDLPNGERYLVMEFLEGESLHTRLWRRKFLAPLDVAHVAVQLLEGLARVHEAGIVHRDLKPGNVFLARGTSGDFVKILDFGVCKMLTRASLSDAASEELLLGTLPYMAPEQLAAARGVDVRADIFSVGIILYRCVTGKAPYLGNSIVEHAQLLREGRAQDVRELAPDIDETFAGIVHRAMDIEKTRRHASARELQNDLVAWMNRSQRIENLLGDYLGMRLATTDMPPPLVPPKATDATVVPSLGTYSKTLPDVGRHHTTRRDPRRDTTPGRHAARKKTPKSLPRTHADDAPVDVTHKFPKVARGRKPKTWKIGTPAEETTTAKRRKR